MQIVIISGMSGAGKSYALQTLEDTGYYCIDNLPSQLIEALIQTPQIASLDRLAIGLDIRGGKQSLKDIPKTLERVRTLYPDTHLVYLFASQDVIHKRYNETRRSHPLSGEEKELAKAIALEEKLLMRLAEHADWRVDTSHTNVYELGRLLKARLTEPALQNFSLMFQSFGFKHESPTDSDFIFDVRCLPNPYWVPELRGLTGRDKAIVDWLEQHERVKQLYDGILGFLELWMQDPEACQRAYLTVSIGCTGGRHRSVYIAEALYKHYRKCLGDSVLIRHRELNYIR